MRYASRKVKNKKELNYSPYELRKITIHKKMLSRLILD